MQWQMVLTGLALFLIFEGMLPFAAPRAWRQAVATLADLPDRALRAVGGAGMAFGVVILVSVT